MPYNSIYSLVFAESLRLPTYRDKRIQAVGIPMITLFGQYLTYNYIWLNWMLAYVLLSATAKILVVWQVFSLPLHGLDL